MKSVRTKPGASALQVTPLAPYSTASARVKAAMAPLAVAYAAILGMVACPATEDIRTMRPKPRLPMPGKTARAQWKAPLTCTLCKACHSAAVISTTGLRFWLPALLTSTSMARPAASSWETASATATSSATLNGATWALMPSSARRPRAASQASRERSLITTCAPAFPNPRAMA
ncbi:hypothetical protein D3C85_1363720 [compost metagenome]